MFWCIQDPLLIVHGLNDDNVHFQDAARLVQKLIELEKEFEVMFPYFPLIFPRNTRKHENISHGQTRTTRTIIFSAFPHHSSFIIHHSSFIIHHSNHLMWQNLSAWPLNFP
ncbi:MAG: prolyl oligopeptidase family serine peptidase [Acidobacteria bacterium]|jgi:hypothetical protein|nr:prolyl oligopeptidase family serine peptidase [Acidobacteriota bacterium]